MTTSTEPQNAQKPSKIRRFQIWAAENDLPLSSAYELLKRLDIQLVRIGRRSFISDVDAQRVIDEALSGRLAGEGGQARNLKRPEQKNTDFPGSSERRGLFHGQRTEGDRACVSEK